MKKHSARVISARNGVIAIAASAVLSLPVMAQAPAQDSNEVQPRFIWGALVKILGSSVFSSFGDWLSGRLTGGVSGTIPQGGFAPVLVAGFQPGVSGQGGFAGQVVQGVMIGAIDAFANVVAGNVGGRQQSGATGYGAMQAGYPVPGQLPQSGQPFPQPGQYPQQGPLPQQGQFPVPGQVGVPGQPAVYSGMPPSAQPQLGPQQAYPQQPFPQAQYPQQAQSFPQQSFPQQSFPQQSYPAQAYPQQDAFAYPQGQGSVQYPQQTQQPYPQQYPQQPQFAPPQFPSSQYPQGVAQPGQPLPSYPQAAGIPPGMPQQAPAYPQQAYPQPALAYPPQAPAYATQAQGYPPQGFPQNAASSPVPQPGYAQPGYPPQPGYPQPAGYPQAPVGYPAMFARGAAITEQFVAARDVVLGRPTKPLEVQGKDPNYEGVHVAIVALDATGKPTGVRSVNDGFRTGEKFKLRVVSTFEGLVAIDNINPKGEQKRVYPDGNNVVAIPPGKEVLLPLGADEWFELSGNTGKEQLVIAVRDRRAFGDAAANNRVFRQDEKYGSNFVQEVAPGKTFPVITQSITFSHSE